MPTGKSCCQRLPSVIIGIAGPDGDLMFPELADFVESALRVEDSIFRVTRERAMLLLADVDRTRAGEILDRLLEDFRQRFPTVLYKILDDFGLARAGARATR